MRLVICTSLRTGGGEEGNFLTWRKADGERPDNSHTSSCNMITISKHHYIGPLSVRDSEVKGFAYQTPVPLCCRTLGCPKLSFSHPSPSVGTQPCSKYSSNFRCPRDGCGISFSTKTLLGCSQVKVLDGEDEYYKSLSPMDSTLEEDNSAHPFFFPSSSKGASAQH